MSPLQFSYIKTDLKSSALIDRAQTDIFLQNLFSNNVIMDGSYGFTYSNKAIAKGRSFSFLHWDVIEIAGNTLTFINQILNQERSSNGRFKLFGVNYFQYARSAIDYRFNTIYDRNHATVYRIYTGLMMPYGNSPDYTPFEKRFFVGGANSLRAWRPRSIGPGSFVADNQIDHSGDVKLEMNAEYRFNIYHRWLEGALFTDAGNIWALKKDATRPGAEFSFSRFYEEVAIDAGFGLRLNFTIVLIRFDLGIPLRDPTYAMADRWVIRNFRGGWLSDNLYFNFGIGYPF
jgi:outer membrane protein assembly factor BamA